MERQGRKLNTLSVISIGNSWNDDVGEDFQGLTCFMKSGMKSGRSGLYQSVTLENLPITNGTVFDLPLNENAFRKEACIQSGYMILMTIHRMTWLYPAYSVQSHPRKDTGREEGFVWYFNGTIDLTGALDAHYGVEKAYDYFKLKHGRLSYDNLNSEIKIYMHLVFPYQSSCRRQ